MARRTGSGYGSQCSPVRLAPAILCLRLAHPDATQEQLYAKPPHFQILPRAPLKMGPRRLPARQHTRRPGSLSITASCVSSGGFIVTRNAARRRRHPRRHAPALVAWHSARQFAGILRANPTPPQGLKVSRGGIPQDPHPSPNARPPAIPPGGCARKELDTSAPPT